MFQDALTLQLSIEARRSTIQSISKVILCLAAFLFLNQRTQGATVIVRPAEIGDVLVNPGMGIQTFRRSNGDPVNPGVEWSEERPTLRLPAAAKTPDFPPSTVAYCRWHWSTLEPEQGNVRWEIIDLALHEAKRNGQRLAFRLMPYDPKHPLPAWYRNSGARRANSDSSKDANVWQPDFSDPLYFKFWSTLVMEAGKRYDGHPDLDSVDISTVGYWGEGWSDYMPEFAVRQRLIDVYLKAFRKTPLLMNFDEPEALSYGTARGTGWRFDCLGDMQQTLGGHARFLSGTDCQSRHTGGVEKCSRVDGDVRRTRWHVSTVNVKSSAIPKPWKAAFEDLQRRMGYRFALRRAEWKDEVKPGEAVGLSTWWVNEGVAPVYRAFVLAFRFRSSQRAAIVRTGADVRRWIPGDVVFEDPLFVPDDLPAGDYEFGVALLDPATLMSAIKLSIQGRGDDGWYTLGRIRVNPASAP